MPTVSELIDRDRARLQGVIVRDLRVVEANFQTFVKDVPEQMQKQFQNDIGRIQYAISLLARVVDPALPPIPRLTPPGFPKKTRFGTHD